MKELRNLTDHGTSQDSPIGSSKAASLTKPSPTANNSSDARPIPVGGRLQAFYLEWTMSTSQQLGSQNNSQGLQDQIQHQTSSMLLTFCNINQFSERSYCGRGGTPIFYNQWQWNQSLQRNASSASISSSLWYLKKPFWT